MERKEKRVRGAERVPRVAEVESEVVVGDQFDGLLGRYE